MPRNFRLHAIAIGTICVVIVAVYLLMKPAAVAPQGQQQLLGDRYIQIYSATWGDECNPYIDAANSNTPLQKDKNGLVVSAQKQLRVMPNNVLDAVSGMCNGKLTCALGANSKSLGVEPLQSCYKRLKVSYRCYTYDRLWNKTIEQGSQLTIDCNETAAQPAQ